MSLEASRLWEEGEYEGIPCGIAYAESALKGTPYMRVTFNIGGHKRDVNLWLSPAAETSTMSRLKDLGFNGDFVNPALSRTTPCRLTLKHGEYNGKPKEEWSYWGEQSANLDKSAAASLSAKFRQAAGSVPKPAGAPKPVPLASDASRAPTAPAPAPVPSAAPPAPKAPPPPPPAPPTAPAEEPAFDKQQVAHDEQSAWAYWLKQKGGDQQVATDGWLTALDGMGKRPSTPEEWNKIALMADVPF